LNFRISNVDAIQIINKQLENRLFKHNLDFDKLIEHDELSNEKNKGLISQKFEYSYGMLRFHLWELQRRPNLFPSDAQVLYKYPSVHGE
jgi:hypothetical protein